MLPGSASTIVVLIFDGVCKTVRLKKKHSDTQTQTSLCKAFMRATDGNQRGHSRSKTQQDSAYGGNQVVVSIITHDLTKMILVTHCLLSCWQNRWQNPKGLIDFDCRGKAFFQEGHRALNAVMLGGADGIR